ALPLRDAHLPHRLHAGPRGDRALGQPREHLAHDLDGLAELHHAYAVARVAVAGRLHRHPEVEVLVGGVRLAAAQVVGDARATDERAAYAEVQRQLARDHADTLRAQEEERVVFEHRLVLADAPLDEVHRLAAALGPAGRYVVTHAAYLVEAVEQPGAGERLEEVQHELALADGVEEHGGATAERAAHVHAPGPQPETVRGD